MENSKVLVLVCLSFVAGVTLASFIEISRPFWPVFLLIAGFLVLLGVKRKTFLIIGLLVLCFFGGVVRFQLFLSSLSQSETDWPYARELALKGFVCNETEQKTDGLKFEFCVEQIRIDKKWKRVTGKVLVTAKLYPKYHYGDNLKITGELKKPKVFEDFDYREYLAKQGIHAVMYQPKVGATNETIEKGSLAILLKQKIFEAKQKSRQAMETLILPPAGSVLKAIILGDKSGLSDFFKEKLNRTGTRHIVAISGMHMIIAVEVLIFLALAMGLWRGQAFYLVIFLMLFYIIFIGAPPSAVRAGIMAGLLLLSQKIGRLRNSGRSVILAATLMLAVNPTLLLGDVGFQLSFLATLSIIYLKPILDRKTEAWLRDSTLKSILTMTLAAQIGVLPLLILHFGRFSIVSPIVNIMVVPLLPLIMILGGFLVAVSFLWMPLAKMAAFLLWPLLAYLISIINFFASFGFSMVTWQNFSWLFPFVYYLILAFIVYRYQQKQNVFR